uniref:Uncharacterized protein n=1 Tax=Anguilla anguilla TaxID=7936 RepID=A0A0E9WKW1_ANGAN
MGLLCDLHIAAVISIIFGLAIIMPYCPVNVERQEHCSVGIVSFL